MLEITQEEKNVLISDYRDQIARIWEDDVAIRCEPIEMLISNAGKTNDLINRIIELDNA